MYPHQTPQQKALQQREAIIEAARATVSTSRYVWRKRFVTSHHTKRAKFRTVGMVSGARWKTDSLKTRFKTKDWLL